MVALVALIAGLSGIAQAVDFDVSVRAPTVKAGPALKTAAAFRTRC